MVPRIDAFMIDITNDNDRNIDSILEMDYSRIPVYHEDKDNIKFCQSHFPLNDKFIFSYLLDQSIWLIRFIFDLTDDLF